MKSRKRILTAIALLTFVTIGTALAQKPVIDAARPAVVTESTGMFGITANQTARFNVFNGGSGDPGDDDDKIELLFVDVDGKILAQKVYELGAGKAAFLDLRAADLPRQDTVRTQMRAMVRYVGTPDTRTYMWAPTLEVFDNNSGETRFLLPAVQKVQKVHKADQ